jgi:hypothetical protein
MVEGQVQEPVRHQPQAKRTLYDVVSELDGWYLKFKRTFAGHQSLQRSLDDHNARMQAQTQGREIANPERMKGLPLFKMSATSTGTDAIDVSLDLKQVDPQHVGHVIIPLTNMLSDEMADALGEIQHRIGELQAQLVPPPPEPQQP